MNSQFLQLQAKHRKEIDELRENCTHPSEYIKIREDRSQIGKGTAYPVVHVVCCNCGTKKIIFNLDEKQRKTVKKTLKKQGFRDERLDLYAQYDWELG